MMIVRALLLLAALPLLAFAPPQARPEPRNPVIVGADPHLAIVCDTYWLYPTNATDPSDGFQATRFYGYASRNLRRWTRSGPLLDMADIRWIDDDGAAKHYLWAPALAQANGRYYLYYSVGPQNPTPSRIGVAVADRPGGPFRDSGRPLLTGGQGFEAIDPEVFVDPASRKPYLYAGGSAGAKLRVFELAPTMTDILREVPTEMPRLFTEGPFVHLRNNVYYLSYSHGRWNDASYSVHYATGRSPEGPWTYRGPILKSDRMRKGPGHHSIVRNPTSGDWFVAYHRWDRPAGAGPFRGVRVTAVQRLEHDERNGLRTIRMTDAPPPPAPIDARPC
ncbi:family 43 glycosylhydrolase [uncultured Sphingomonas sp.]|uniref:family 43 glycosylhydrolase n=1 Tax=uncultured Sphingomonas sp. TaxID=158754 RepID=UPI0035CBCE48